MCSTWRSSGIATARAASITRSTSRALTSPPRTATMPWLLSPRTRAPASPTTAAPRPPDSHARGFLGLRDGGANRLDRGFDIYHHALAQSDAGRHTVAEHG